MVITEDIHPQVGEVIWVWCDKIARTEDRNGNRLFRFYQHSVRDIEVPLSVHDKEGRAIGLMIPKVLAGLNGLHAN